MILLSEIPEWKIVEPWLYDYRHLSKREQAMPKSKGKEQGELREDAPPEVVEAYEYVQELIRKYP